MKILMTTMKLDIGGAETHIVELSKELKRRGHDVCVVSNGGSYVRELEESGITHCKVPLQSKSPSNMIRAYRMLKKIILENSFDIVHAHARIPAFLCGMVRRRVKFPFVTTAHWVFNVKFPLNILTDWGDRSLAVSEDIKQYLIDNYGLKPDKIGITNNGIDGAKFSPDTDWSETAAELGLERGKTRIVYISRMDADRSLAAHKLIAISDELDEKIKDMEILIVGGGDDFENIKAEADAKNAQIGREAIKLTGSRTDINRLIASGKIFVGVSRAALEAMSSEKPCIIAGNEGYIGIFAPDKLDVSISTNFCCRDCGDTTEEKLKRDILSLLENPDEEKLAELGRYSRETVEKYYSVGAMANDAEKMYKSEISEYLAERPLDVAISGYYGYENSGDDAVLKAIINGLRAKKPDINITVLSKKPAETRKIYNADAVYRYNILKIARLMKHTKLLISGGGSLIQDVTSTRSLDYYLNIIRLAECGGARTMLYANGIGPIENRANHCKIKRVLNGVSLITLRERSSLDELSALGVTSPSIKLTADPAFALTASDSRLKTEGDYFVISIRRWKMLDSKFERKIAEFADYVSAKYSLKAVFVPMQPTFDTEISKRAISLMKHKGILADKLTNAEQIIGIISGAKFIAGMRLHTLIYAASRSVPSIGLIYDPKIPSVMSYMGQDMTVSVRALDTDKLKRFADKIMSERSALCASLTESSEKLRNLAYENTDMAIGLIEG